MNSASMNPPRDFHITETPTLHFVATEDEIQLSEDLRARLEESLRLAEEHEEVIATTAANRAAAERLQQLKNAERALHQYARESGVDMGKAAQIALDTIIDTAATGEPDFTTLARLRTIETRNRYAVRALERLVEHQIPLAQIAQLREASHELLTRARAIEKIAQERAEKVLGQLRDVVLDEIVLPVDMSKGVAGALLAHAGGLKKLAIQKSENADLIEKSYTKRASEERR